MLKGGNFSSGGITQSSTGAVRSYVAGDPNAVGYISFAEVDNSVKALSIDGVAPTYDTIANGTYPIQRDLLFVTNGDPSGNAKAFIDFTLSPAGQAILKADKEVSINDVSATRWQRPRQRSKRRPTTSNHLLPSFFSKGVISIKPNTAVRSLRRSATQDIRERTIALLLLLCGISSVCAIFLIITFIFAEGLPFLVQAGPSFLISSVWRPTDSFSAGLWGIFPIIVGSLIVTLGAVAIGTPLGVACAVFLAEIAPAPVRRVLVPSVNALAGVPSVVYGFFGLLVIVPWIRGQFGGFGTSVFAAWLILFHHDPAHDHQHLH